MAERITTYLDGIRRLQVGVPKAPPVLVTVTHRLARPADHFEMLPSALDRRPFERASTDVKLHPFVTQAAWRVPLPASQAAAHTAGLVQQAISLIEADGRVFVARVDTQTEWATSTAWSVDFAIRSWPHGDD